MRNFDWRWVVLLVAQVGCGLTLLLTGSEDAQQLALLLLGSAFGQGATGSMSATK